MLSKVQALKFPKKAPQRRQLMKGSAGSETYTQQLVGAGTLYFGVSSLVRTTLTSGTGWLEGDHPLNHIAVAILRIIYKRELGSSVENLSQNLGTLAPPMHYNGTYDDKSRLRAIVFYVRQKYVHNQSDPSAPSAGDFGKTVITPEIVLDTSSLTMKFGDLAARLAYQLQEKICKHFNYLGQSVNVNANPDRELYGYSVTTVEGMHSTNLAEHRAQLHSPIRRLDNRKVKVKMDTRIMFTPTYTKGGQTDLAMNENDLSNYVHQDAYYGKMYYFKDPYPVLDFHTVNQFDNNQSSSYAGTEQASVVKRIIHDSNGDGIMRPNTDTSFVGLAHFPLDTEFKNLSRTGTFMCSNGGTRTMNLTFDFFGSLNKFFKGYKFVDTTYAGLTNYPEVVGEMNGTSMLFAIKQHNPQSYTTDGLPALDPMYVGLTVKRNIYVVLGKEHHDGMDIHRWETTAGVPETAIPKDVMNV